MLNPTQNNKPPLAGAKIWANEGNASILGVGLPLQSIGGRVYCLGNSGQPWGGGALFTAGGYCGNESDGDVLENKSDGDIPGKN